MHSTHAHRRWGLAAADTKRPHDRDVDGPGMLASPAFWLSGLVSLGCWAALAWAVLG